MWKKIHNWSSKQLSQAGRAILTKSVLQSIPTYVMGCFRLPDSLLGELESMLAELFWNWGTDTKIHWLSWNKCCERKEARGLGFRRLRGFNLTLLARQAWRVAMMPDNLLHKILGQKYFPNSNFIEAGLSSTPSFTWRSSLATREISVTGLWWKVGNRQEIPICDQPWIPHPRTFQLVSRPLSLPVTTRVVELIRLIRNGMWT
ncbi:UNVERIFIED_CONTAM: hypothetical protein Slati_1423400 [Sesamum latifolium]|uniref:Uncharacterized protein n=1 Tax=Sesamum latifolium TaxID=2727402 RepID=A0AAW2X5F9_9LAMI